MAATLSYRLAARKVVGGLDAHRADQIKSVSRPQLGNEINRTTHQNAPLARAALSSGQRCFDGLGRGRIAPQGDGRRDRFHVDYNSVSAWLPGMEYLLLLAHHCMAEQIFPYVCLGHQSAMCLPGHAV